MFAFASVRSHARRRRGISMVEATLATLFVGVVLTASLSAVSASWMTQSRVADQARAQQIADAMLTEILDRPYEDTLGPTPIGLDGTETLAARATLNDVDDYDSFDDSPPTEIDGTPIAGFTGWSREVRVEYIEPNDLNQISATDKGIKKITVTVRHLGGRVAEAHALRTRAWGGLGFVEPW